MYQRNDWMAYPCDSLFINPEKTILLLMIRSRRWYDSFFVFFHRENLPRSIAHSAIVCIIYLCLYKKQQKVAEFLKGRNWCPFRHKHALNIGKSSPISKNMFSCFCCVWAGNGKSRHSLPYWNAHMSGPPGISLKCKCFRACQSQDVFEEACVLARLSLYSCICIFQVKKRFIFLFTLYLIKYSQ